MRPILLVLATVLFFVSFLALVSPSAALKPRPFIPEPDLHKHPGAYQGPAGELILNTLSDIERQFDHYRSQATLYDRLALGVRALVFICSIASALVLALGSSDLSRRTALVLSILIASIPVADQQFHISALNNISWRTAVDLSRTFANCRYSWVDTFYHVNEETLQVELDAATALATRCREHAAAAVNGEMDVSLQPILLPEKIEPH